MTQVASRGAARRKRHERIRLHLAGTQDRPRLAVFRSLNHIYAQVIDDASGRTLVAASTVEKELKGSSSTKTEEAAVVGRLLAERAKGCVCPPELPVCVCGRQPEADLLTRRAVSPGPEEIASNARAKSAHLRAAVKIGKRLP